jgi:dTDP-4-amino-4,6-dideoxygalactose transaminase
MYRDHGSKAKYEHDFEGFNSRMDGIQAAILRVKLRHLEEWTQSRRRVATMYREALSDIPGLQLPVETPGAEHVYHLYVVRVADRDRLLAELGKRGVAAGIHYPTPIHLHKAYEGRGWAEGSFPAAEQICSQILSLPMYPEMGQAEVNFVADAIRDVGI